MPGAVEVDTCALSNWLLIDGFHRPLPWVQWIAGTTHRTQENSLLARTPVLNMQLRNSGASCEVVGRGWGFRASLPRKELCSLSTSMLSPTPQLSSSMEALLYGLRLMLLQLFDHPVG